MKGKIDMEQRYKMALEAIKTLIDNDNYADRNVIKIICDTALNVRSDEVENEKGDENVLHG